VGRGRGVFVFEKVGIPLVKINVLNASNTKRTMLSVRFFWYLKCLKILIFKGGKSHFSPSPLFNGTSLR